MASEPPTKNTPAKFQHMEQTQCIAGGSSTLSTVAKNVEVTLPQTATPRTRTSSMASISRKRGHPKSASLNANRKPLSESIPDLEDHALQKASAQKGFNDVALSFGARNNNVPTHISTLRRSLNESQAHGNSMENFGEEQPLQLPQMRELPPPSQKDQTLQRPHMGEFYQPPKGEQVTQPGQIARLPPLNSIFGNVLNEHRETHTQPCQPTGRPVNPYAHRADEVGLRHRFPSMGAVDDFLTPPNWLPGQDPIDEAEAQQLYDEARELAKQNADDYANLIEHNPDREERLEAFQKHWQAQRRMDESILVERSKIHKAFLQFKREQAELASGKRKQSKQETSYQGLPQRPLISAFPQSHWSLFPGFQSVQQAQLPGDPRTRNDTPSPPLGAYHLHQRLQLMEGLHLPDSSPLSPSFLDPTLVPQTYEAALHYYYQNKMLLNQYGVENERYLATWSAKFNRQPLQGSLNSPSMPPTVGVGAGPFASVHGCPVPAGHIRAGQIPMPYNPESQAWLGPMPGKMSGPLPGQMITPGQSPAKENSAYGQTFHTQPNNGRIQKRSQSRLREVQNTQSPPKPNNRKRKSCEMTIYVPEGHEPKTYEAIANGLPCLNSTKIQGPKDFEFVGPEAKVGREKKRGENANAKAQFQDEIAAAKLPAPTISDEALRAVGVTPKPKPESKPASQASGLLVSSSKPRGRPRKAPFPVEGIRVSGSFGNALIAAGAKDTRQRPLAPAPTAPSSLKTGLAPSPYAPTAGPALKSRENMIDTIHDLDVATTSGPVRVPNKPPLSSIAHSKQTNRIQEAQLEKSSSREYSHSSTDGPDHPNDGEYGKHTSNGGHNATRTPKASVILRKPPSVPAKRPSSITTVAGSAEKRSHQSLEASNKDPVR